MALPETQTALVQPTYASPFQIQTVPVPAAIPGSAVIKILSAGIVSYSKQVYNGELASLSRYLSYGGLRDINFTAGEKVVVGPATGGFGGAAVAVAVAMGANIIALGRSEEKLKALVDTFGGRVQTVKITENAEEDTKEVMRRAGGPIDAAFEISPPEAAQSTLIKSCISALRRRGRLSIMGGIQGDVAIPLHLVMHKDVSLQGKWMYDREDVFGLLKLVEAGLLKLGKRGGVELIGEYGFAEWEQAFDVALENSGWNATVIFKP